MAFQMLVTSNVPLTPIENREEVTGTFLRSIGYLSRGSGGSAGSAPHSVAYRLVADFLLRDMEHGDTVGQMARRLGTTKATAYRHLNKLKAMDLLEEVNVPTSDGLRRGYRLRYGNLAKAWNFVEAHVQVAMEHYRETVEHLQRLAEESP